MLPEECPRSAIIGAADFTHFGQDTIPAFPGNLSKPLLGDKTSNTSPPTSPNRSALLTGMAIGVATVLLVVAAVPLIVVGSYYFYEHQLPPLKSNSGSR